MASGNILVGQGKLIDPAKLAHVFISPLRRAQRTFELAFDEHDRDALTRDKRTSTTDKLIEWNFGDYEGRLPKDIRASRKERGMDMDRKWNILKDGCENGE